jgi:hypothetical protein
VGGSDARKILFYTDTGRILLKRLQRNENSLLRTVFQQEMSAMKPAPIRQTAPADDVTLF